MINIAEMDNGNLLIQADNETRSEIAFDFDNRSYWQIMSDLFEPCFSNGSYTHFDASHANPFVGLTSAPCIAENMIIHDDGQQEVDGKLWYFPNYMLENELETLKNKGRVIYTLVQ